jgi:hypothetical protein
VPGVRSRRRVGDAGREWRSLDVPMTQHASGPAIDDVVDEGDMRRRARARWPGPAFGKDTPSRARTLPGARTRASSAFVRRNAAAVVFRLCELIKVSDNVRTNAATHPISDNWIAQHRQDHCRATHRSGTQCPSADQRRVDEGALRPGESSLSFRRDRGPPCPAGYACSGARDQRCARFRSMESRRTISPQAGGCRRWGLGRDVLLRTRSRRTAETPRSALGRGSS